MARASSRRCHRPRDTPRSLFGPEQPPSAGGIQIDAPYFVPDPLLDPSFFPSPGWFAGAEVQIVKPHLINDYGNSVFPGKVVNDTTGNFPLGPQATTVNLPAGPLDWTASPRVFAGYRLPSGFGEFMIAYRHLGTTGSSSVPDTAGPIGINSRFAFDIIDLDYNSRELSLWPKWDMKWTLGLRNMFLFSATQGTQPFGQAASSNGIVFARQSNNVYGIGPHAALELNHRLGDSGWSLYTRIDAGAVFSRRLGTVEHSVDDARRERPAAARPDKRLRPPVDTDDQLAGGPELEARRQPAAHEYSSATSTRSFGT